MRFFSCLCPVPFGICFLDEFDKKLTPSYSAHGNNTTAETQSNLHTIVEGSRITNNKGRTIDSSRLMFIGMGSFNLFRSTKSKTPHKIGFGEDLPSKTVESIHLSIHPLLYSHPHIQYRLDLYEFLRHNLKAFLFVHLS